MDSFTARKLIARCFPEFRIKRSRKIRTGWENFVLEVNGDVFFRFPKFRGTENRLRNEIEFLPALTNRLSTPIPNYEFIWKGDRKYPHWFGGYKKLEGVSMSIHPFKTEWTRPLAREISRFLKELYTVRVPHNRFQGIPRYSPEEWHRSLRQQHRKIRRIVYPLLGSELRARSSGFWRNLFADFGGADFRPTLIHGDLSTENILFDPSTLKLTGILDWGYAQVSDPALEFAHLFMHNPGLGKEVLKLYRTHESDFEKRVHWYVESEPFYDVMWGVEHHWEKAKKQGMRQLTRALTA